VDASGRGDIGRDGGRDAGDGGNGWEKEKEEEAKHQEEDGKKDEGEKEEGEEEEEEEGESITVDEEWAAELLDVEPTTSYTEEGAVGQTEGGKYMLGQHRGRGDADRGDADRALDWRESRQQCSVYAKAATKPSFLEAHPPQQGVGVIARGIALVQRSLGIGINDSSKHNDTPCGRIDCDFGLGQTGSEIGRGGSETNGDQ
jgi:hypothetical protein